MIRLKKRSSQATAIIAITAIIAMAFGGTANADDISNSIDASIDAVAEAMPLNVGGANGSTTLYVSPTGGDGKNGCNLTGSTTLGLTVSSSNTAVATVSPSSVTFASCGDIKTLTVTPVAVGTATVSTTQTSNSTGGSFNLASATFTVNVAAPANTAPGITVAGVTGGASYIKGSVPAATCQVTDVEDGDSTFAATLSQVTGGYASDGIGSQTATCSYMDAGGLTATESKTYSIVDPSTPVITYSLDPAAPTGANGWYTGDVSLTWNVSEPQSPNSVEMTGCVNQDLIADQAAADYSCSATSAGGPAATQTVNIKRDGTAPSVSDEVTVDGVLGANGWYTSNVVVEFTATDALSGPATESKTVTSSGEGNVVTVESPAFTDEAGNTTAAGAVSKSYKIDKSAPNAPAASLNPAANTAGWNNDDVVVSFSSTGDNGPSGVDSCTADVPVTDEAVDQTVSGTCTDQAGNVSAATEVTVRLDKTGPGIAHTLSPTAPNANGWYKQDVAVDFSCTDTRSGIDSCTGDTTFGEGENQSATGTAIDNAGNTTNDTVSNIDIDKTGPSIDHSLSPNAPNGINGWYTTDVDVDFSCGDALSGIDTCTGDTTLGQGENQSATGTAIDNAGNTTNDTVSNIDIDKSAPNAPTASQDPTPNAAGWNNSNVTVGFAAAGDNGPSGIANCTADVQVTSETASQTVTGTCTDNAGNVSAATQVTVKLDMTAPSVSDEVTVDGVLGANGWYTSNVVVEFTATDALSGPATESKTVTSSGEGNVVTVESPAFTDEAGNTTAAGAVSKSYKIDKSAPNAPAASLNPAANTAGWNNDDVVVSFSSTGDNGPSGVDSCTADVPVTDEAVDQTVSGTCTDQAGNVSAATEVTVRLDKTGPGIAHTLSPTAPNANGWYKQDVAVDFSCTDTRSGIDSCTGDTTFGEGENQSATGTATDNAGNTTNDTVSNIDIDKTNPSTPTFNGGPGSSYYFGNDPAAPTCSSSDALSGLDSCMVTGGGTTVGSHSYTATATDNAGNTSENTHTYTVLAWTTRGFFSPVDMGGVWNTVKGGSTVPLKFELFAGTSELTSVDAVQSFMSRKVSCTSGSGIEDAIEVVSTGGTSLRYDTTGGQFIQNWKTPTGAGNCYSATMTADDGSIISALFKTK